MSLARASTAALAGLACFAIVAYAFAERSVTPVHAEAYRMKLKAVHIMQRGERAIAAAKHERGVDVDSRNDPYGYGVIGPQFSLITTDRGSQRAKMLAAHPNFAAGITQLILQAGVHEGDVVAVGVTGSLPGLNLAVYSACQAIGAQPVVITSVGASMFGANDPELTWLDMESVLSQHSITPFHSLAASLGGGGDVGRGLSPSGRQLILDAIERNHVRYLDATNLLEAVRGRVALYDSVANSLGKPIKLYINVGGGLASLGGAQNGRLIPAGLTHRLAARNYPNRGVINVMAERRIPVIHLLQVNKLARDFDMGDGTTTPTPVGKGLLFIRYRYNPWIVGAAAILVLLFNLFVLRLDLRQRLLGRPHPEGMPTA